MELLLALFASLGLGLVLYNVARMLQSRRPNLTLIEQRRDEIRLYQELIGKVKSESTMASADAKKKIEAYYARFPRPAAPRPGSDDGSSDSSGH